MMPATSSQASSEPRRTRSILAIGALFLALGVLDVFRGLAPLFEPGHRGGLASDDMQVLAIGVAALIGGIALLGGRDWARWLLAGWMALHVAISLGQPAALAAHLVIFGSITFLLFRSRMSAS